MEGTYRGLHSIQQKARLLLRKSRSCCVVWISRAAFRQRQFQT